MIAVLVPCFGYSSKMIFINRNVCGLSELQPIVLTLDLGDNQTDIPTLAIRSQALINKILSRILVCSSDFWNNLVMHRPQRWEDKSFGAGRKLSMYFARPDIELVLVHFVSMGTSFISQLSKVNVPVVVICHACEIYSSREHKPYLKRLERLFNKAVKVLCVSKYIKDCVVKYGCPPEKAEVFYLGVELPNFQHQQRSSGNRLRYITTGRLVPIKEHEFLLRSFAQLFRNTRNVELVLIGDGQLRDKLQSLAYRLNIANAVTFLGSQDNSRVYEELYKADVYVHTSGNEALGISIAEAMAAQLPVVATNVGGIPEIVENGVTGILVPPGDMVRFTKAMDTLAKDTCLRRTMGLAGRRVVEDKFNVHKQNARIIALLRDMIKDKNSLIHDDDC